MNKTTKQPRDRFQAELQADARRIDATVDTALRQRLDARIEATARAPNPQQAGSRLLTWASVATGLVAVALFVAVGNRGVSPEPAVTVAAGDERLLAVPLQVENVDLTEPLQQELTNLQADVALARETLERELKKSF